jgi:hypothetical protein
MKTIEQLDAEHAKAHAKLEWERAFAKTLPLPPDHVMQCPRLAPWATYKVQTLSEAIKVFETFAKQGMVQNMEHAEGTFTHVCPPSERGYRDKVTHKGDYCVAIRVSQGEGYGPTVELSFYAETSTGLCHVHARLEQNVPRLGAHVEERRDGRGRLASRTFHRNDVLNGYSDESISFASGDYGPIKTGADIRYLWIADDGADCMVFDHALEQLRNLAAEIEEQPR